MDLPCPAQRVNNIDGTIHPSPDPTDLPLRVRAGTENGWVRGMSRRIRKGRARRARKQWEVKRQD